ncbi:MAG: hypothetical protein CM1200mP10_28750 [Candidatus Neomarinimicrobiota bacterium]|nr:MAG: hypothetical protein CM1200mP10_28750 [Candidatus Neomarinimicrobiota bacterium]
MRITVLVLKSQQVSLWHGYPDRYYFNTNFIPLLKTVSNLDVKLKSFNNTFFGEDDVQ